MLTELERSKAIELRREKTPWTRIERVVGRSEETIRREIDPGYAELRARQVRENRARKRGYYVRSEVRHQVRTFVAAEYGEPIYDPRRDAPRSYRSISYELLGDPPIGRSALDMRK